jgi:anti-sigma regulatory factor (Ser/Thr protein kinase)
MRTTRRFERQVPEIPRSRHFVAEVLRSHGAEPTDEVLLVASELITNAVCHGNGDVELRVEVDGPTVRLEVLDEGHSEVAAPVVAPPPLALGGRGLALVREVSRRWGAGFDAAGRTMVWAELMSANDH